MNKYYYFYYFFNYFVFAVLSVNMIPFLKSLGYSSIQRGVLFAMSAFVGIVLQFIVGYICDKYKILKRIYILLEIIMVIACFFLYKSEYSFFYYLFAVCVVNGLYKTIYNLMDSWVLESDISDNFGRCRALGAIGFTIGSLLSTFYISKIGYENVSYIVLVGTIIGIFITSYIKEPIHGNGLSKITITDFKALFTNRLYLWLIALFLLVNLSATADQYTTVDKLLMLGANEVQIGLKWSIQSISEVPMFLIGDKIMKRIHVWNILIAGICLYILKFILYGYVGSIEGVLLVTLLQMITYPLITLSSRLLIREICIEGNLKTSTQLIASGIYLGGSALLSPLIGGYLIDTIGSTWTLYGLGGFLCIPLILSIKLKQKYI